MGALVGETNIEKLQQTLFFTFFFRFWPMNRAKARSTSLAHAGRVLLRAYVVLSRHCSKIPFWCFMPFRLVPVLLSHLKAWIKNILHSQRWLIYAWFIRLEKQKVSFGGWLSLWHFTIDRTTLGCDYILSTHRRWGRFSAYFIQEKCLLHLRLSGPLLQRIQVPQYRRWEHTNRNKSRVRIIAFYPDSPKLSPNTIVLVFYSVVGTFIREIMTQCATVRLHFSLLSCYETWNSYTSRNTNINAVIWL